MKRHSIDTPEKRAFVKSLVRENPRIENRKLARLAYSLKPQLFQNVEAARTAIRAARGALGPVHRKSYKVVGKTPTPPDVMRLPDSIDVPSKPFEIQPGRTLILSDIHIPFHDRKAVEAAVGSVRGQRVDTVFINGDLADFFSISRWLTDPSERNLVKEVETIAEFLRYLRSKFPKAELVWKEGNHEERLAHYLWTKAPELYGLACLRLEEITGAAKLGVKIVADRLPVGIGSLAVFHGHELAQGAASPVNPARGLFIRLISTAAMSHLHRSSEHAEKIGFGDGRFITCWSIACLCHLSPMYARTNKWNHGCAIVESRASGDFSFHNKRIHNGRVL